MVRPRTRPSDPTPHTLKVCCTVNLWRALCSSSNNPSQSVVGVIDCVACIHIIGDAGYLAIFVVLISYRASGV